MSARTTEDAVGFFWKNLSNDLVPIDPDNISNKDWVILLEAGTITGPSPQRIRVARWMQEKKIVKKHDMFLRTKYFIVVEGYNPRDHALYFCPQLFRYDSGKLVPLEGEDIGRLIARGRAQRHRASPVVRADGETATGAADQQCDVARIRHARGRNACSGVVARGQPAAFGPAQPTSRSFLSHSIGLLLDSKPRRDTRFPRMRLLSSCSVIMGSTSRCAVIKRGKNAAQQFF